MNCMRKSTAVLIAVVGLSIMATSCFENEEETQMKRVDITTVQPTDTVYICTGSGSKRFHASDSCTGLNSCTKIIKPITRGEAEKKQRTHCLVCFKEGDAD